MKWQASRTVVNGAADPDPIANPELVTAAMMLELPERKLNSGTGPFTGLWLLLYSTAGDATVSVYSLIEDSLPNASRRFLLLESGVVCVSKTPKTLAAATFIPPDGGKLYIRVTAETVGADFTLYGSYK